MTRREAFIFFPPSILYLLPFHSNYEQNIKNILQRAKTKLSCEPCSINNPICSERGNGQGGFSQSYWDFGGFFFLIWFLEEITAGSWNKIHVTVHGHVCMCQCQQGWGQAWLSERHRWKTLSPIIWFVPANYGARKGAFVPLDWPRSCPENTLAAMELCLFLASEMAAITCLIFSKKDYGKVGFPFIPV